MFNLDTNNLIINKKKIVIIMKKIDFISVLVLVLARFIMGCVLWEHEPT